MSTGRLESEISKKSAVLGAPQQGRQTDLKRVGFFAGSFDPIHDGHLEVANSTIEQLDLDKVMIMVEKMPWSSKAPVSLKHRNKMVNIAIKNFPKINLLELDDDRFDIDKTLPQIENIYSDSQLYFIFGADVFMQINSDKWPGLEKLLKHNFVVFERGKITEKQITDHAKTLEIVVATLISKHPHHSSTDIRLRPHDKELWVNKSVSDYIQKNKLY